MAKKDFYEILGVSEKASTDEIKKVYRELAKKYHPDRHSGDRTAEDRFKEISEAYSVLSDSKKRAKYDQMRKLGAFDAGGAGGFDFRGFDLGDLSNVFTSSRGRKSKRRGFSFDDFGSFGGMGDVFSQFFDMSNGHTPKSEPRDDSILNLALEVPFETAASGGKVQFTYNRKTKCKLCKGTGAASGRKPTTCSNCKGTGKVATGLGGFAVNRPCPQCFGKGIVVNDPCKHCKGSGAIDETRTLAVPIKPGTEDGKKIRLKGQGNFSKGDLILTVRLGEHKFFKRKGLDVYCNVPINMIQAALGAKIRVKTIDGKKVEVKIPQGTQNGTTMKLRGMGATSDGRKGDQYVTIRVETPTDLTDKQKEILREF